jgi:sterol desaturase/sphingolipid hydroxylase (fatty acid hydroxylase superfamily)
MSLRGVAIGAWFAFLAYLETRRALRTPEHEPKLVRDSRNLAVAGLAGATVAALEAPAAAMAVDVVNRRGWGLVQRLPVPAVVRALLAIALLDYTLYLWHVLTHRVPFLWRFHKVHHIDRDLDTSTALRFHFGEMAMSVPFRVAQVLVIGPDQRAFTAWQTLLFLSILFHHSNVRLPLAWDRRIARLVVTPRLHGIHHSVKADEVNSNWSSGLTVWDAMHGTLRTDVPQESIEIGVPGYGALPLPKLLALPFRSE